MPRYKIKQREILAWLFISSMKIELEPLKLSIAHTNRGFLKRFYQMIRLGHMTRSDLNRDKWQVTNPKEMTFFLNSIEPHIRTQRERRIAELLIKHIQAPNEETKEALIPMLKIHNMLFLAEDEYFT